MDLLRRLFARAGDNPWLLLSLTALFWGGNVPAARLAVGEISPMLIVGGRWAVACVLMVAFLPPHVRAEWKRLLQHWPYLLLMALSMTISNGLIFTAAAHTSGLNLAILQGVTPVVVLIGASMVFHVPIGAMRFLGVLVSIGGVILVATHGQPTSLFGMTFNLGDLYQIIASSLYAGYALGLRVRPQSSGWALFSLIAFFSFLTSLPAMAWEAAIGATIWPTWKGLAALVYIAVFTSLLGQVFFMRSVELVGPGRAAVFHNLTPVIGAMLSVLLLGEALALHHVLALAMVLGGIYICERYGPR
jgi:drug/metabolite transporter (DMT)-like permease